MNKVLLVGRLTKDVELKRSTAGTAYVNFNVAINRRVAAGQQPQTDFINCVAWSKTAELMAQFLHKGSQVGIEGRIQTRNYDKDGVRVYITEVVADRVEFLSPKSSSSSSSEYVVPEYQGDNDFDGGSNFDEAFSMDAFDASDEDLPF